MRHADRARHAPASSPRPAAAPNRRQTLAGLLGLLASPAAFAQAPSWRPGTTVRIVVPFPPGGSTDAAGRILAEDLAEHFKRPVIVENKPGAGTTIAAAYVAASPADGHTLLLTGPISHLASGQLYPRLRYDALKDYTAVCQFTTAPFIVAVRADSPLRSLAELLQQAKTAPDRLSFGSSGTGASPHLVGELLAQQAGVRFLHVPYKGAAPANLAVLTGETDFAISDASAIPQVQAGRLRALAVTTARRSALLPDVPTVAEAVAMPLDESTGIALLAPAGTPEGTIAALQDVIAQLAAQPATKQRLAAQGMEVAFAPAAPMNQSLRSIHQRYESLIRRLGIRLE